MSRRKKGNRRLPPGLYSWTDRKTGTIYWKMAIRNAGSKERTWIALGPISQQEALAEYRERMADPDLQRSRYLSRETIGCSDFLSTVYLPHLRIHADSLSTFDTETERSGWLCAHFKQTDIRGIDTAAIERYKRWRREHGGRRGKSGPRVLPGARTINLELHVFRKALRYGVSLGLLAKAPTFVMLPEAKERREPRWLNAHETDKVIAAATPKRRLLLLFAFHTGMRPGEISTRWKEDLDLERGFCRVGHRAEHDFRVKRERPRVVPLTPALQEALSDAWNGLPVEGPIFGGQSLKETLRRVCNKVGFKPLNPYGTRHSFISRWAQEQRSRDALIKIVGHADGRMIDQIYAHFGADELADHMVRVSWGKEAKVVQLRADQGNGA